MPRYRLYPLDPRGESGPPFEVAAFDDSVAMRWAMGRAFPNGCDIFLDDRFVGRVHGAALPVGAGDETEEATE